MATPIDPLFLLLPALAPTPTTKTSDTKRMFLETDEYFDTLSCISPHFRDVICDDRIRQRLQSRMGSICDSVDAGEETMYRLSERKLLLELLQKAEKMAEKGLPASMEDKLIRRALEMPMLSLKRGESSMMSIDEDEDALASSGGQTPATESADSQTTVATVDTVATSISESSTAPTSSSEEPTKIVAAIPPLIEAPEGVTHLLRIRTAFAFMSSSYLPAHLSASLATLLLSPTSPQDFKPLDAYLAHLTRLRQDAQAARSFSDFSHKRSMFDDEENETRAEKKRKKEEEEKRQKAGQSRGVRDLKKVNVKGMKKMSDFFKKK